MPANKKSVSLSKVKILKFHINFKTVYWFGVGVVLGLFLLTSFTFILFQTLYKNVVFPGITIDGVNFTGKTKDQVERYFAQRNKTIENTQITFLAQNNMIATISARHLGIGYNTKLLGDQAMLVGRSADVVSNISLVFQAYLSGLNLSSSYTYSQDTLNHIIQPFSKTINTSPADAAFTFENGRVTTFRLSQNGKEVDTDGVNSLLQARIPIILGLDRVQNITIHVPIKILRPKITTEDVNKLGIKELIGTGTSLFQYSIPSRIYNINLATSRINGALVAPGDTFSFDKILGDVSSFTGYKQAYVIQNGHTVLGDGGGVCQVSTTLFRAALNAGLPIVERHAHDYRVEYYEEDGPPGIDATVYVPSVDLKFKNDTEHYILIQGVIDPDSLRLTFNIYGVSDGRTTTMTYPVVTNIVSAPAALYQNDPTLPKGVVKQTDFSANGADVTFTRTVMKNGQIYIQDTYDSHYRPWQAVYLVGTM